MEVKSGLARPGPVGAGKAAPFEGHDLIHRDEAPAVLGEEKHNAFDTFAGTVLIR